MTLAQMIAEHIIIPDSPVLKEMIGQKILDIGFYLGNLKDENSSKYTRETEKAFIKKTYDEEDWNWNTCFSRYSGGGYTPGALVLVLEKQHLGFISRKTDRPKLEVNFDLTLDRLNSIAPQLVHFFYSANQDPDMSDEMVREMLGKRILAVDLIRVADDEDWYSDNRYRYCVLKLYLEGGMVKLVGTQYEPSLGIEIRNADGIDPARIDEVIPIRKEGYSIE